MVRETVVFRGEMYGYAGQRMLCSPAGRGMNRVKHTAGSEGAGKSNASLSTISESASSEHPSDAQRLVGRFAGALVIDDDDPFRRALSRWLRALQIQVSEAKTVAEGNDLLAREPSLVITDVRLPDGNGRKIVELARRRRPVPLIVAVSGLASAGEAFALAQCGARIYLSKPFAWQELIDGIIDVYSDTSDKCGSTWLPEFAPPNARAHGLHDAGAELGNDTDLRENLRWFARYYAVPRREMALVQLATSGVARARCPEMLGVSENTCKTLTRRLLQRCGARSLAQIPRLVLMGAPRVIDA
jgi:DNA-binding NarL/FixJ family response regulator